ncbi:hypothetical protein ACFQ5D_04510 [Paenibacillus farraposensis]|uniref:Alpha/beta hydrolase n=1 Tax=Paenibacillus farraposensis TaxID=2807095 RepID=A0ABW4D9Q1_9BACL|nr:hypothetical protein [Paenibacillus farraposensis]MCC3379104.1 hypothetical protein [Paenibacillus farraposensis]
MGPARYKKPPDTGGFPENNPVVFMHGCEFSPWLSMMFCRLAKVLAYHGSKVAVHDESLMYTYVGYQAAFRAIF